MGCDYLKKQIQNICGFSGTEKNLFINRKLFSFRLNLFIIKHFLCVSVEGIKIDFFAINGYSEIKLCINNLTVSLPLFIYLILYLLTFKLVH